MIRKSKHRLEKVGYESYHIEMEAAKLQVLENIDMYIDGIFEMSNYRPDRSGLPYGIWFDDIGPNRKNTHYTPRLKVELPDGDFIPVSIGERPKILLKGTQLAKAERKFKGKPQKLIFDFISRNHEIMLQHWNQKIDFIELTELLKLDDK